jgi:hypothetical protein
VLLAGLWITLTPFLSAAPQQLPDATLRAAFLYNFARFTTWPDSVLPPGARLNICTDDDRVMAALRQTVAGKPVEDHTVDALIWSDSNGGRRCHVAYLRRPRGADPARVFADLAATSVLTVGDDADAIAAGAVVHFFVEDRRLRFAVSMPSASRAGLQLSSRLLALAVVHK